jgi:hypothetical protein
MHSALTWMSVEQEMQMRALRETTMVIVREFAGPGDKDINGFTERVRHLAPIRQRMIEKYLDDTYSHVFWLDSDIVHYPPSIIGDLLQTSTTDIVAPAVYLERAGERWYDTAGFIEDGRWANLYPPHFSQEGPIISLDSVGCMYVVPADLYREGARHEYVHGLTDHYSVCRFARDHGRKVLCDMRLRVYHARLARFGEVPH